MCMGMSLLCLFLAIALYFCLDIRTVFADLTGLPQRKENRRQKREQSRALSQKRETCFFVPEREILMIHTERQWRKPGKGEEEEGRNL